MYLDSNIFISPLVYEGSRKAANAKRILGMVERGDMVGYTSTQTWDEIVWVVRKLLGKADSVQAGEKCHQASRGPKGADSRGLGGESKLKGKQMANHYPERGEGESEGMNGIVEGEHKLMYPSWWEVLKRFWIWIRQKVKARRPTKVNNGITDANQSSR